MTNFENQLINRRSVLTGAASLIALSTATSTRATAADSAKQGGVLKIGTSGSTTDTLNPATLVGNMEILLAMGQLRNCLIEINENSEAVPELAESWESRDDLKTWHFKIRKDVEFHNGKQMDVEDVLYSIKFHMGEDSSSGASAFLSDVVSLEADGEGGVIFTLGSGNADFPYILSDYHLQIVPAGTTKDQFSEGVGTGGYILEEFQPGVRAVTRRNPNYWKQGRAHFDSIETIVVNDSTSKTNGLMTGELNVIINPELKTADRLKQQKNVEVAATYGRAHPTLAMQVDIAPFDDEKFRLALKYAIDREDIVAKVLQGYGEVGNDHPISSAYRFYDDTLPQHSYDPERAKVLLAGSSYDGATIDLHTADAAFEGAVDMAVLFQEQAKKAGININVVREPDDGYWDDVWMKRPFCVSNWFGRPTEDMMFTLVYSETAAWNETGWASQEFDALLSDARKEQDAAERRRMYSELQNMVSNSGGTIVPFFNADLIAHDSSISHGVIASNAPVDGFKLPERWWLA